MATAYRTLSAAIAAGDVDRLASAVAEDPAAVRHWKPIVDAAFAGRADMVRVLVDAGADPNIVSGTASRHTPLTRLTQHHLTIAKHEGHAAALVALLEGGADADLRGGPLDLEPLAYAAMGPALEHIELLKAGGARIGIHLAAVLLDGRRLGHALREPARAVEQDPRGRTPLHYVALSGLWKTLGSDRARRCAARLLEAGAEVDHAERIIEGDEVFHATPLWYALGWQRHLALAEFLLDHGADPNPGVFTVLFNGGEDGCELLDRYGADWEQTFHGRTPLMDIMHFKRPAASAWLLARGVDVGARDGAGRTALHFAAMQGVRAEHVQRLLDAGADAEAHDDEGRTPGDYAVLKKRAKLIALLKTS